jgi:hypothetical protein
MPKSQLAHDAPYWFDIVGNGGNGDAQSAKDYATKFPHIDTL